MQRLPVRIELTDYDPDKTPLFAGLSVTPYVYYKEPPTGPNAGQVLKLVGQPSDRPGGRQTLTRNHPPQPLSRRGRRGSRGQGGTPHEQRDA